MNVEVIEAIIVVVGSIVTSLVTNFFLQRNVVEEAKAKLLTDVVEKHKSDAEAAEAIVQAAKSLLEPLKANITEQRQCLDVQDIRIKSQEKEIAYMEKTLASFLVGVRKLIEQIRCLGQDPVWTPDMVIDPDKSKR